MERLAKVSFIHDWLVTLGGAEQILDALLDVWPDSPIHTLVSDPDGQCKQIISGHTVIESFIAQLPQARKNKHRRYLPLMPLAIEQFDLRSFDILISCSHAVSHGVLVGPEQLHINYICVPIRYAWHLYQQYLEESGLTRGLRSVIARIILHYIRLWDVANINRIDHYVAISKWVAQIVWRVYRQPADVIYPPVDVEAFTPRAKKENYYLAASRMVPYKKMDLIVEAFSNMHEKKLIVIGDGPDEKRIRSMASKNVEFLGFQSKAALIETMQRAKAFVFAAEEDFGILPVEAQACGTPVIAYGKGGALETVIEGKTGIFFREQTVQSLKQAITYFEEQDINFDMSRLRAHAESFSVLRFQREFKDLVEKKWREFTDQGFVHMYR